MIGEEEEKGEIACRTTQSMLFPGKERLQNQSYRTRDPERIFLKLLDSALLRDQGRIYSCPNSYGVKDSYHLGQKGGLET